jgi:ribosomal-protein-alanine N-acetyltransferase
MQKSLGTGELTLEIVRMRRRHLRGVMAIERRVYPRPWSPSLFLSEIGDEHTRAYFVGRVDRRIVTYGGLICYGDEAHITTIAVDPEFHRRKIGTRMLYELMRTAIDMGATATSLEVRVSNWNAQRLYSDFGFRPVGVRKNYYQEVNEDALVMWVDDIQSAEYLDRLEDIVELLPDGLRPVLIR